MDDPSKELIGKLDDLIRLDYDAIEAYDAAIERLETPAYRDALQAFRDDHARHVRDLSKRVRELGGDPSDGPGAMALLTKGKVVIGGLVGEKAVLLAMKANEIVTNLSYEHALHKVGETGEARRIVERNREDERRHKAWIDETLAAMGHRDDPATEG